MREVKWGCDKCGKIQVSAPKEYWEKPDGWFEIRLYIEHDLSSDSSVFCNECCGPIINLKERRRAELDKAKGIKDDYGNPPEIPTRKIKSFKEISCWFLDRVKLRDEI